MRLLHECKFKEGEFTTGLQFFHDEEREKIKVITDKGREFEIDIKGPGTKIPTPIDFLIGLKEIVNEPNMDLNILNASEKALEGITRHAMYGNFTFKINNEHNNNLLCVGELFDAPDVNLPNAFGDIFTAKILIGDFIFCVYCGLLDMEDEIKKLPKALATGLTFREIYILDEKDLEPLKPLYNQLIKTFNNGGN